MSVLRITEPDYTNRYYRHVSSGGVNECIRVNGTSCLPNCVGYAWGAWYEMMGVRPKLSRRNAKEWYGYTADGYRRSSVPELGAVACWNGRYGHVAIVVGIFKDYIVVAQSNYGGNRWEKVRCYKYGKGYKSHGGNTAFQGFICLPDKYRVTVADKATNSSGDRVKTWNLSGIYGRKPKVFTTKCALNMRDYPSTTGKVKEVAPRGRKLYYYGYGAKVGNICWYYVQDAVTKKEGYVYGGKYNSGVAPYLSNARP